MCPKMILKTIFPVRIMHSDTINVYPPGNNFNLVPITVRAKVCEDPGTGHPTGWFCLCRIR